MCAGGGGGCVCGMRVRACYTFSCTSVFILYVCQSRFFFLLCSPFRGVFGKRAVLATVLTQPFVGTNSRNKSLPKPNVPFAVPVFTAVIKTARRKGIISVTMVLLKGRFWSFPPVPPPPYPPPLPPPPPPHSPAHSYGLVYVAVVTCGFLLVKSVVFFRLNLEWLPSFIIRSLCASAHAPFHCCVDFQTCRF